MITNLQIDRVVCQALFPEVLFSERSLCIAPGCFLFDVCADYDLNLALKGLLHTMPTWTAPGSTLISLTFVVL